MGELEPRAGVLTVIGNGLYLRVESGQLVVSEGKGGSGIARFSRAFAPFNRLVIVGSMGLVTLAALRWLRDVQCSFVHVDRIGRIGAVAGTYSYDDARLRRAQALAPFTPVGLQLVRELVARKLTAQSAVLADLDPHLCDALDSYRAKLDACESTTAIRSLEARAASVYWRSWADVPLTFARRERVPEHWRSFGLRASPLTNTPRSAVTPANAILNYLYSLLESEARLACLAVGLDAGLGLYHEDHAGRDSLSLDAMEPVRPAADALALTIFRDRAFRRADFIEGPDGRCRLSLALAAELPQFAPSFRAALAPIVEWIAGRLPKALETFTGRPSHISNRTPLTESQRLRGRWEQLERKPKRARRVKLSAVCVSCGKPLDPRNRKRKKLCADCLPAARAEQAARGAVRLAELRAEGRDPNHGGEVGLRRGAAQTRRYQLDRAWELAHPGPVNRALWDQIRPALSRVRTVDIARACGLSVSYASEVKAGRANLHPRHWLSLYELVTKAVAR